MSLPRTVFLEVIGSRDKRRIFDDVVFALLLFIIIMNNRAPHNTTGFLVTVGSSLIVNINYYGYTTCDTAHRPGLQSMQNTAFFHGGIHTSLYTCLTFFFFFVRFINSGSKLLVNFL